MSLFSKYYQTKSASYLCMIFLKKLEVHVGIQNFLQVFEKKIILSTISVLFELTLIPKFITNQLVKI